MPFAPDLKDTMLIETKLPDPIIGPVTIGGPTQWFFWCTAVSGNTAVLPMSPPTFYYAAVRAA